MFQTTNNITEEIPSLEKPLNFSFEVAVPNPDIKVRLYTSQSLFTMILSLSRCFTTVFTFKGSCQHNHRSVKPKYRASTDPSLFTTKSKWFLAQKRFKLIISS